MDSRRRGHFFKAVLAASTAIGLIASLDAAVAQSATNVVAYNIPAQPLTAALTAVAQRSGLRLAYTAALSAGRTAPALQGSFTPAQAIGRLLAGTGLTYRFTSSNTVTIERPGAATAGGTVPAGAIALDTIDVQGAANPNSTMTLMPAYAGGQVARGGQLGMLGNKDMMDSPFNQTVYTRKLIEDQQAKNLGDVLINDPSVVKTFEVGGGATQEQWSIRGVGNGSNNVAFGGLYGIAQAGMGPVAMESIERVEVLKGANTLLNGLPPGQFVQLGTVNLVPKRAGDQPLIAFTPDYAMNSQFGGHLDVGRRFGDNKEFGIRFNGVYRDGNSPINHYSRETKLTTLGLDYRGANVRLSADLGYQHQDIRGFRQVLQVATGVPIPKPPHNTHNWAQPWLSSEVESKYATTRGEWDINENLTAYAAFGRSYTTYKLKDHYVSVVDVAGTIPARTAYSGIGFSQNTTAEAGLRGHVQTGPVHHALALAAGWGREEGGTESVNSPVLPASNLYNPVFFPEPDFGWLGDPKDVPKSYRNENQGVALADTMSILDERIQLMLGVRHQKVKQAAYDVGGSQYGESALSPAAALVVKPLQNVSLYANYMQALEAGRIAPANSVNAGEVFAPFKTTQYEVGVKVDFGRVAATLAAFTAARPTYGRDPDTFVFGETGKTRYQGIEFSAFGEVTEHVRFVGGMTFLDPRLVETPDGTNVGNQTPGVPRYRATLGTEWDTPFLDGLTLGATAQWQSFTYFENANLRKVDGWHRFDLSARYTIRQPGHNPIILRATVRNVLDRSYWAANSSDLGLSEPRTFLLSTTFQF